MRTQEGNLVEICFTIIRISTCHQIAVSVNLRRRQVILRIATTRNELTLSQGHIRFCALILDFDENYNFIGKS